MENFELIDDYLRGQLKGQEKEAFENQLQADPTLQSEVTLQQQLIEGIKKARIAELKTMLSQVPVTGAMQVGAGMSAGQIAAGVITSAVVVTGTLFYFQPWNKSVDKPEVKTVQPVIENTPKTEPTEITTPEVNPETKTVAAEPKKKEAKKVTVPSTKKVGPDIQVIDPTDELTSNPSKAEKAKTEMDPSAVSTSRIEVETDDSNKEYAFHYQFNHGKLRLYGKFDKGLYEIIEVNGNAHSVFLFYKDNYYLLDEKENTITPLTPIKDSQLIKKLKEYRKG
ncbi:MAG: hypothetical protein HY015_01610 [Bacteroidetes bacterium]|nr:hypothetical protein [Bacteroidota bacterium]